jgi:5-amino-6-(5-phospho-D-ribitylamino)uracil phosphatase
MAADYKALVAIDVDGTLLDTENRISKGAAEAIKNLREQGIISVLASGRSMDGVAPYYEELDLAPYLIGAGGALISTVSGEVVKAFDLPDSVIAAIIKLARGIGVGIALHQVDNLRFESNDEQIKIINHNLPGELMRIADLFTVTDISPTVKFTLWDNHDLLLNAQDKIRALGIPVDTTFSGDVFLEITNPGVSKGHALQILAQHLNIPENRIAAVGDQFNDVSMLQTASISIAMGNAPEAVKAVAQTIAPINDKGGLAWGLENVVLKTWCNQN